MELSKDSYRFRSNLISSICNRLSKFSSLLFS
nr:MAG TPA: hypothetical protein [Bacteriophage sp.]